MCTEARREFRKQFLNDLKQHYGCAICNSRTDLTFHHIFRSSKKFNIANKKTVVSTKNLIEEINKTVVLCLHCHNVYHSYEDTNWKKMTKLELELLLTNPIRIFIIFPYQCEFTGL